MTGAARPSPRPLGRRELLAVLAVLGALGAFASPALSDHVADGAPAARNAQRRGRRPPRDAYAAPYVRQPYGQPTSAPRSGYHAANPYGGYTLDLGPHDDPNGDGAPRSRGPTPSLRAYLGDARANTYQWDAPGWGYGGGYGGGYGY